MCVPGAIVNCHRCLSFKVIWQPSQKLLAVLNGMSAEPQPLVAGESKSLLGRSLSVDDVEDPDPDIFDTDS